MTIGLYPLSGDPPTKGHLSIIKRSSQIFEKIHVVIFNHPNKKSLIPTKDRIELIRQNMNHQNNIIYNIYTGLTSDYCQKYNIQLLIRGFRNQSDLDYEYFLEKGNKILFQKLETMYLRSHHQYSHISSSSVKSLLSQHALIHEYVPPNVKEYIERNKKQYLIGITGSISVGKTTIGLKLETLLKNKNHNAHYIDLDKIVHHIYQNQEYPDVLNSFKSYFGEDIISNHQIHRSKLSKMIFSMDNPKNAFNFIKKQLESPIRKEIQKYIREKENGFFLIDGTVIIENNMLDVINYNLIMVHCSKEKQISQLMNRNNIGREEARKKINIAKDYNEKLQIYQSKKDNHGLLLELKNDDHLEDNIQHTIISILEYFKPN